MRKISFVLAIGLLTAACTSAGASGSPVGSPTVSPAPTYDVATGPDQLVLRISSGGGLVPPGYNLTAKPWFALYGDGRIVVQGPVIEIYPSPLLPNLRLMRVTPAEIQKIIAAADQAGLLGPDASYDAAGVYDAGTTTFTTTVAGKTHTIDAYALGIDVPVTDAAVDAARKKLSAFDDKIGNLSAFLGRTVDDTEAYEATSTRIFTSPSDPAAAATDGLSRQVLAWPLSVDPGTGGEAAQVPGTRCLVVTGPDLAAFLASAKSANALTVWTSGAGRYSVSVRPLYPDETGCRAAQAN